jgi:hypothetical protein
MNEETQTLTEPQIREVNELKSTLIDKLWKMKDLRHDLPFKDHPLLYKSDLYNTFGALRYRFNKAWNKALSINYFPREFLDKAVSISIAIEKDFERRYSKDVKWMA